jgi:hypothetical protein
LQVIIGPGTRNDREKEGTGDGRERDLLWKFRDSILAKGARRKNGGTPSECVGEDPGKSDLPVKL